MNMSIQQVVTDEAAAKRAKAAGRRYRRQQSAFDILILFLVVQVASVIYGLISPDTFPVSPFTMKRYVLPL